MAAQTMSVHVMSGPAPVAPETLRCPLDGTATRLTCVQYGTPVPVVPGQDPGRAEVPDVHHAGCSGPGPRRPFLAVALVWPSGPTGRSCLPAHRRARVRNALVASVPRPDSEHLDGDLAVDANLPGPRDDGEAAPADLHHVVEAR